MDAQQLDLIRGVTLPKIVISLNNIDNIFSQRVCKQLNLQVVDKRTYYIWSIIMESVLYQVVDMYTGSFTHFVQSLRSLPDLRDFDRVELLDYHPGLRSASFSAEVKIFAMQLGMLMRNSVPCDLETYDIFFDKYWEGSLVLSVFHKSLMKEENPTWTN